MLGGGATDRDRSTENDPELDADDARCPPLGVEVSALVRVEGGGSEGRVVVGGVDAVAGGGGMLGAFGNGVLASADGGGVLFSADGALDVVDEWMGVFSTLPVVCASGSVVGSSGAVGRPTAARSASLGALVAFGAILARSEPKSTGGSAVIEGGGIDTGFFGGAAIDGEVFGLSAGAVDAVDAVAAGVAVGAGNEPVTARRAPVVSTRPSIDGGGMLTDRVVALGDTLVALVVALGVAVGVALVALGDALVVALLVVLLGAALAVLAVLALAVVAAVVAVVDVVGGADVVAEVAAGVAVGGDELVALVWRAPTASGESDAAARGALGGGTRTDGDVPCAGGCSDAPFPLGGGTDVPAGFAPSSPSPTLASEGTFGAAGTAPSAGDFTGSSPGKRTAGIARLEALRARTGGALAMNTSRFSIARNGVQCCPSGDSSSAGVMRPSATHARSSPLLGRAARVPLGRRTFHGR